jgi:F-type H+-transporting ATPase subunit delta
MPDNTEQPEQQPFDSNRQQLGLVYAKALLASSGDETERVIEELDSLVDDVLAETPKLEAALCSPRLPLEDKQRILDKAFQGKMNSILLRFLKVVAAHERSDCLREIRIAAKTIHNEQQGRVEIQVQTAEPLDEAMANTIRDRLASNLGREVLVEQQVDPSMIGGLVVRVGDTVYDGSVANRLDRMRTSTLQSSSQTIRNSLERFSE